MCVQVDLIKIREEEKEISIRISTSKKYALSYGLCFKKTYRKQKQTYRSSYFSFGNIDQKRRAVGNGRWLISFCALSSSLEQKTKKEIDVWIFLLFLSQKKIMFKINVRALCKASGKITFSPFRFQIYKKICHMCQWVSFWVYCCFCCCLGMVWWYAIH